MTTAYNYDWQKTALFGESLWDGFHDAFTRYNEGLAKALAAQLGGGWHGSATRGPVNALGGSLELSNSSGESLHVYLNLDGQLHVQALVVYYGVGVRMGDGQKFKTSWDSFKGRVADDLVREFKKNFGI